MNGQKLPYLVSSLLRRFKAYWDLLDSQSEYSDCVRMPRYVSGRTVLLGKTLLFPDGPSFFYSQQEIFVAEIYAFDSDSGTPRIIDCGSNIGLSIIFFKTRFPNSTVTAVEADPKIREYLETNLASFGIHDVEIRAQAVAGDHGPVLFQSEGADAGRISSVENAETVTVPACTLDDLIDGHVDLLKIDIEGAEINAVLNCSPESMDFVQRLFVEYHSFVGQPQRLDELLSYIRNAGFRYSIHHQFVSPRPFQEQCVQASMDLQLNLFCWKTVMVQRDD